MTNLLAGPNGSNPERICGHDPGVAANLLWSSMISSTLTDRFRKLVLEKIDYSADVSDDVVRINQYRAAEKDCSLNAILKTNWATTLTWRSVRLNQVLLNLFGNAIKFTDKGKVIITFLSRWFPGSFHSAFEVNDTGIGIPEDKQSLSLKL